MAFTDLLYVVSSQPAFLMPKVKCFNLNTKFYKVLTFIAEKSHGKINPSYQIQS